MLFQRFTGPWFTNNQFSCFNSLVMRSSLPVLSYPFLPVPFRLCFPFFLPFLHHSSRRPAPLFSLQTGQKHSVLQQSPAGGGTAEPSHVGRSSGGCDHRGVTSWEEKRRLLGAWRRGPLRKHPEQPESTCCFLGALVSGGHPECDYLLQVLCEELWQSHE